MIYYNGEDVKFNKATVVTIGNFDGIHKGHIKLIENVQKLKNEFSLQSVLLSFWPHPVEVFKNTSIKLIYTVDEKKEILESYGLDAFVQYPFSMEFSHLEPEDFIKSILIDKLNSKYIVVGENYRFGKNQASNIDTLKYFEDKYGYKTISVPHLLMSGEKVSSSLIREFISNGDINEANDLLGRNFFLNGTVVEGKKLGRTIGFPTINIEASERKLLPKYGVYVTKVIIGGDSYIGATNVGNNPTVEGTKTTVETFILDFNSNIYGKDVKIEFYKKIRNEVKFNDIAELKKQIYQDELDARSFFS